MGKESLLFNPLRNPADCQPKMLASLPWLQSIWWQGCRGCGNFGCEPAEGVVKMAASPPRVQSIWLQSCPPTTPANLKGWQEWLWPRPKKEMSLLRAWSKMQVSPRWPQSIEPAMTARCDRSQKRKQACRGAWSKMQASPRWLQSIQRRKIMSFAMPLRSLCANEHREKTYK